MAKKSDDQIDRLQRYYLESIELNPKEHEMCERYETIFALYLHHKNRKETISKYMAVLKAKGLEISIKSAYRDLMNAEKLFAPIRDYNKEFLKIMLIESALADLKMIEKKMKDQKKQPTLAEFTALINSKDRVERRIIDLSGLNKEESNLPDFANLTPHQYKIEVPKQLLDLFVNFSRSGVSDLTGLNVEDIDFEELEKNKEDQDGETDLED